MEIKQYKKVQSAFEKANGAIIELLDTINELDPSRSLFGDISIDLDSCEAVLQMSRNLRQMTNEFNLEFERLQGNRMIENRHKIAGTAPKGGQQEIWSPKNDE